MDSKLAFVKHQINEGVATITFYHPKGNSFPTSQLRLLESRIHDLGENDQVKLIILKSEEDNIFCAGASFDELVQLKNSREAKDFFMGFAKVILAMRDCPKFIIGAIEGKSVGGGVGIMAACDYAIARDNASIKLSELSIGIGPFVIEPALKRKMGLNAVTELTLNPSKWKSPDWALEKGLYNAVLDNDDDFKIALHTFTEELSRYSPKAMKDLKSVFWQNTENWKSLMSERAQMSGNLVMTEESQNILKSIIQS